MPLLRAAVITVSQHLHFVHGPCQVPITAGAVVTPTDHIQRFFIWSGKCHGRRGARNRNQAEYFSIWGHHLDSEAATIIDSPFGIDRQAIDAAFRVCEQSSVLDTA